MKTVATFSDEKVITGFKTCPRCGSIIYLQPSNLNSNMTSFNMNINTSNSYRCPTCETTTYVKTADIKPNYDEEFIASIFMEKKKKYAKDRCKICRGSGYDFKGKPCRDCTPSTKGLRSRWFS